jgi:2-succinyl-6-hydroxy-2,4-cyclohexadiene-1-carboxylate synthase
VKRALLHGFLGDPSAWNGIIDGLAIALPGHRGGPPVAPAWAQNLDTLAPQLRGCDLAIGYSLGARVALGLLAMGAVPRVVLISVNPGIDENAHEVIDGRDGPLEMDARVMRDARRASDRSWAMRFRSELLEHVLDAWESQALFATQSRVAPELRAARRARRMQLDPEQLARSLESMGLAEMPDYRTALTRDRCTLIVGADDAKYLALAHTLDAPLHVIDHCGHDPLFEQPAALAKVLASLS